ncbi:MAG: hypothetical protein KAQ65_01350 [Candidatus Thorarchaeota archaeon]|nr:hypothetical protein [Candidatus Thorarchaeota archaeon]MCK5238309.1 hypothetical protein [Candidatus Thorarchaeota archaeon]
MQFTIELTFWSGILAGIIAIIGGIYLAYLWRNQSTRLMTDLPLVFAFSFILQGVNMFMLSSMNAGILPDTLEVFKIRTFVIGGSVFPFLTIIMHIWLSKYRKYFKYTLSVSIAYWIIVTLIGTSASMIMILVMPILIVVMFGMILTFAITYKTGRLKEVRSGLILIAMAFMAFSQLTKVSLMAMGLSFIADTASTFGTFLIVLAVANPWKKTVKEADPPVQEVYA